MFNNRSSDTGASNTSRREQQSTHLDMKMVVG